MHSTPHPHAGRTVKLIDGVELGGQPAAELAVEDWADIVFGQPWQAMHGHHASLAYAMRSAMAGLPVDNEVVYGKDRYSKGHLVHVSEIDTGDGTVRDGRVVHDGGAR